MPRPLRAKAITVATALILAIAVLSSAPPVQSNEQVTFTNVAAAAGIHFRHHNAASSRKYLIETMGSGGAWIDFDDDGDLDLFLVNGGSTPVVRPKLRPAHALFQNLGNGSFESIRDAAGASGTDAFGMGAAAADYDNDGYTDLFVTGYPSSTLYRNSGGGRFIDVTAASGVQNRNRFATGAGWFDYDRDGDLDLLVINYLEWSYEKDVPCGDLSRNMRQYCHPENYKGVAPVLYRNNANGTFSNVTKAAGLDNSECKGLGLVLADFDLDGWPDIFIANDSVANAFYWNRGDGTFEDASMPSGVAYSEDGVAEAGMGTDASDFARDGFPGLYVTHLEFQWNRLYRYHGQRRFTDYTVSAGLTSRRNLYSGFGTRFMDYDNDSWPDLVVVNGHILDNIQALHPEVEYAEPKLMWRNLGGAKFQDVSARMGASFQRSVVGRSALTADFDNDGDLDLAVTVNGGEPELLRNDGGNRNSWIAFRLVGRRSNRHAVGARVTLSFAGNRVTDQIKGGTGYLGTGDPRLYFGLGSASVVDSVKIIWPSGVQQDLGALKPRQILTVQEPSPAAP